MRSECQRDVEAALHKYVLTILKVFLKRWLRGTIAWHEVVVVLGCPVGVGVSGHLDGI